MLPLLIVLMMIVLAACSSPQAAVQPRGSSIIINTPESTRAPDDLSVVIDGNKNDWPRVDDRQPDGVGDQNGAFDLTAVDIYFDGLDLYLFLAISRPADFERIDVLINDRNERPVFIYRFEGGSAELLERGADGEFVPAASQPDRGELAVGNGIEMRIPLTAFYPFNVESISITASSDLVELDRMNFVPLGDETSALPTVMP